MRSRSVRSRPGFPFRSAAALWESMERSMPPVVVTRNRLGEQAWASISGRVRDSLAERLGTGPVTLDLHAWLSLGTAGERRGTSA